MRALTVFVSMALLLSALPALSAQVIGAQIRGSWFNAELPPIQPPTAAAFVTMDDALSSLPITSADIPRYPQLDHLLVDTSSWTRIDATASADPGNGVLGMAGFGCGTVDPAPAVSGNADADALNCLVGNLDASNYLIELPAGAMDCADSPSTYSCFRFESEHHYIMRGAKNLNGTPATSFESEDMGAPVFLVAGPFWSLNPNGFEPVQGPELTWTGGFSKGLDVVTVAGDTSSLSPGDWVYIRSRTPDEISTIDHMEALVEVLCVGAAGNGCTGVAADQIRISIPLRVDFTPVEATVQEWDVGRVGFENIAVRYRRIPSFENGGRAGENIPFIIVDGVVESYFKNFHVEHSWNLGIQMGRFAPVSNLLFRSSYFGPVTRYQPWQKGTFRPVQVTELVVENSVYETRVSEYFIGNLYGATFAHNFYTQDQTPWVQVAGGNPGSGFEQYTITEPFLGERNAFIHGGGGPTGAITDVLYESFDFDIGMNWDALQGPGGPNVTIVRASGRKAVVPDAYNGRCGGVGSPGLGCAVTNLDGSFIRELTPGNDPADWAANGWGPTTTNDRFFVIGSNLRHFGFVDQPSPGLGIGDRDSNLGVYLNVIRGDCHVLGGLIPNDGGCGVTSSKVAADPTLGQGVDSVLFWDHNFIGVGDEEPDLSSFVVPDSAYRVAVPEDYWCAESGDFPNIGAPDDDFNASGQRTNGMLPAEIAWRRMNGEPLTCTLAQ